MIDLLIIIVFVGSIAFVHWMLKTDKERREREKGYEDAIRREKRNRMRDFGGKDFWSDPKDDEEEEE